MKQRRPGLTWPALFFGQVSPGAAPPDQDRRPVFGPDCGKAMAKFQAPIIGH